MRILAVLALAIPVSAAAEPVSPALVLHRIPANGLTASMAQSKVIYLNHKGVTLSPGNDDSYAQTSSIISGRATIAPWATSAANWQSLVTCFKDEWSRFDVTVTDQDPGNVPHIEAVFGGSPGDVGMQQGVGGVSPFTDDCGIIENSIVFTFTDVFPDDPQLICEVMSQEVAHSYGLDHEMLASDPMTYLDYSGHKTFQDMTASCGEYQNRPCGIGGSTCRANQNSVQLLLARVGAADLVAPTLAITAPHDGATVNPGFEVDATAMDNISVASATLLIDGVAAGTMPGAGPFVFTTDSSLANGQHTVEVQVTDPHGNIATSMVDVTIGHGGSGSGSGSGSGGGGGGGGDGGGDTMGGCQTGGGAGFGAALALLALVRPRRRR